MGRAYGIVRVVECLGKAGFTITAKKCEFRHRYMTYLGHIVGGGTLSVPEIRVADMKEYRKPVTKHQLRAYLSSMSYYRDFHQGFCLLVFMSDSSCLSVGSTEGGMDCWNV